MTNHPIISTSLRTTQLKLSLLISTITVAGLLLCFVVDFMKANNHHWVSLLVKALPLVYFQFEFRKQNPKTYAWFCFLLLVYFIFLMPLLNASNTWLDWLQVALVIICFLSAMMNVRWLKQELHLSSSTFSENPNP